MPELPEVETVKRGLEKQILNKEIKDVFISGKKLRFPYPEKLKEKITNKKIDSLDRRSKYLLLNLTNNQILVIHLGMSGKVLYKERLAKNFEKHDHLAVTFTDNSQIIFNDARRFGLVALVDKKELETHQLFKDLGIEPLDKKFNGKYLSEVFKNKKQPVKQALMDARNLVGVGNIYASESLFESGINPKIEAGKVKLVKLNALAENIKTVLQKAIRSGGSTLRDYVRSDGDVGYFQHQFKVYGREKQPCVKCKTGIKRIVQQGRSSFYCPTCQK